MKTPYIRATHYIDPVIDKAAIAAIKARYGLSTDSDCVRLALRVVATSPVVVKKSKT